ncbi:glycosyltransferase family 2 protein [Chloroflexota bacterium]
MTTVAPVFSIALPVHNGENHMRIAIESVLAQTYPHFLLTILENGSTDNTLTIAESYAAIDERISVVPSQTLLGIEDNWARILELDLHPYMTILCHDDFYYPEFLRQIVSAIEVYPTATVYTTGCNFVNAEGEVIETSQQSPFYETAEQFLQNTYQHTRDVVGSGVVVRSADYKALGGLPPFKNLLYADFYAWYKLSIPGGKVCQPECLFAFRLHEKSTTLSASFMALYTGAKQYMLALQDTPFFEKEANRELARNYLTRNLRQQYHRKLFELGRFGTAKEWAAYDAEKTEILTDALQYDLFIVHDRPAQLYEWIGRRQWGWLRFILLFFVSFVRTGRQQIRKIGILR